MKKKILIVDDEREMVNFMSRKLAQEDFQPLVAYDGREGLKIMLHEKVDAVIADNVMGDMDGYTFCQKLKASANLSDIPIVICTAHAENERDFRKLGIDDYIVKPFKFDSLFQSLNRIFSQISHSIKFKKVLVQASGQVSGIESAVQQVQEYGFRVDVSIVPEGQNIIEETICHKPDILVFNVMQEKTSPEAMISSLKSYVEFKDLKTVLYTHGQLAGETREDFALRFRNLKEYCSQIEADGSMSSLSRESFLSLLFEHCKG